MPGLFCREDDVLCQSGLRFGLREALSTVNCILKGATKLLAKG
jgi:hypothetical protein